MLRNLLGPYWVIHGHHYGLHEHAHNWLLPLILSVPTAGSTWLLQEGLQAHFSAWCYLHDAIAGAAGMASKSGRLEQYSPASYSCTALYMQQRGLSPFPASLAISLIQDRLHLQFQQYFEQRGHRMLSFQTKRQPSSPCLCPSGLLWKDGLLKDAIAISVFPQTPGASNLTVFDFLSSADRGIHLGDHFTRSISPTDWKGLVLILLSTEKSLATHSHVISVLLSTLPTY